MKIVNLKTFLDMPQQTLFCKYKPMIFDELMIFTGRMGERDFCYDSLWMIECIGSESMFNNLEESRKTGKDFQIDCENGCRDGCYEDDQLFIVFDQADLQRIMDRLERCAKPSK